MLDFKELGNQGRGLEQLVRELLIQLGFAPHWSGEGPDGGRDLTFVESGTPLLGAKPRTWLVSCKDNASAGKSVGADVADGMLEQVEHHGAQGYLLVCTTHPSAALVTRLEAIEAKRRGVLAVHYWDGVTLERLLTTPRGWAVAQQFMPKSAEWSGWKVFATDAPNQWMAAHRGFFFHLSARTAGGVNYDFPSLDLRLTELAIVGKDLDVDLRPRAIWHNDTHGGGYVWYVDCFVGLGKDAPALDLLLERLADGISREDGQFHSFEIEVHPVTRSDHFDYDHYSFYDRLPPYV